MDKIHDYLQNTAAPNVFMVGTSLAFAFVAVTWFVFWLLIMEVHRAAKLGDNCVKECGGHAFLEGETPGYILYQRSVTNDYKARLGRLLQWTSYVFLTLFLSILLYVILVVWDALKRTDWGKPSHKWIYRGTAIVWLAALSGVSKWLMPKAGGAFQYVGLTPYAPIPTAEKQRLRALDRAKTQTVPETAKQITTVAMLGLAYGALVLYFQRSAFLGAPATAIRSVVDPKVGTLFSHILWPAVLVVGGVLFVVGTTYVTYTFGMISEYKGKADEVHDMMEKLPHDALVESLLPHMTTMAPKEITADEGGPDLPSEKDLDDKIAQKEALAYAMHMEGNEFAALKGSNATDVKNFQAGMATLRIFHNETTERVDTMTLVFAGLFVAVISVPLHIVFKAALAAF